MILELPRSALGDDCASSADDALMNDDFGPAAPLRCVEGRPVVVGAPPT